MKNNDNLIGHDHDGLGYHIHKHPEWNLIGAPESRDALSSAVTHTRDADTGDGHTHSHDHGHHHTHSPEETKAVINRLSRAIGHLESVKQMVADGRDCSEVLIQLSAVRSALNKTGIIILQGHIEHCIVDAVLDNDKEAIQELNKALSMYFK